MSITACTGQGVPGGVSVRGCIPACTEADPPCPMDRILDTRLWKYYLATTSLRIPLLINTRWYFYHSALLLKNYQMLQALGHTCFSYHKSANKSLGQKCKAGKECFCYNLTITLHLSSQIDIGSSKVSRLWWRYIDKLSLSSFQPSFSLLPFTFFSFLFFIS